MCNSLPANYEVCFVFFRARDSPVFIVQCCVFCVVNFPQSFVMSSLMFLFLAFLRSPLSFFTLPRSSSYCCLLSFLTFPTTPCFVRSHVMCSVFFLCFGLENTCGFAFVLGLRLTVCPSLLWCLVCLIAVLRCWFRFVLFSLSLLRFCLSSCVFLLHGPLCIRNLFVVTCAFNLFTLSLPTTLPFSFLTFFRFFTRWHCPLPDVLRPPASVSCVRPCSLSFWSWSLVLIHLFPVLSLVVALAFGLCALRLCACVRA